MPTHISLLRGINVGGNKKIRMAELKALYESLGFSNVSTYHKCQLKDFDPAIWTTERDEGS